MAPFRRKLSRGPKIPGFVKKNYGTWTASRKENLELLLNTHFPNCMDPDSYRLGVADEDSITKDKGKWAISDFNIQECLQ